MIVPMNYIGCALFALMFFVMTAQTSGSIHDRLSQSMSWLHDWSPYSYLMILILVIAGIVSAMSTMSVPEREEPEDPMAKYRRQAMDLPED